MENLFLHCICIVTMSTCRGPTRRPTMGRPARTFACRDCKAVFPYQSQLKKHLEACPAGPAPAPPLPGAPSPLQVQGEQVRVINCPVHYNC
jgi:hypothetical protein